MAESNVSDWRCTDEREMVGPNRGRSRYRVIWKSAKDSWMRLGVICPEIAIRIEVPNNLSVNSISVTVIADGCSLTIGGWGTYSQGIYLTKDAEGFDDFVKKLRSSAKITIKINTGSGEFGPACFDISGYEHAVSQYCEACCSIA